MSYRVGLGFDAHRLVPGRPLILGGVEIPHDRGLEGHSDGDALLHALTDALLGAVGAPDIGSLFPSGDARWKQASSRIFVEKALEVIRERGYRVAQVDVVLVAEEPRLASHFDSIRSRVAGLLGLKVDEVGIKATTMDGMGFTGRREGLAVQAVALVVKIEDETRKL
jgi:2-C-methyl-D-erythritol 2,4-cyclodiphosphate synthase